MLNRNRILTVWAGLALSGCAGGAGHDSAPPAAANSGVSTATLAQTGGTDDPAPALSIVFQVDVYQLALPWGTITANEEFWKRINEQCVDVATYDLLFHNGIRIGEAPMRELATFRKYLSDVVPAQKLTVTAVEVKNVEIPMKKDLPEQVLFYFDDQKRPIGHSYDRCDNFMTISFQPTPRRPGHLRMTLCPMVRAQRKVLQYSPTNEEREFAFVNPERFYELNMRVDIPRDSFLIVTASDQAARFPSIIGRAFMTLDGPAERMEQVLLIMPRPFVPSDPPSVVGK
jgi:hypothetical protein